MFLVIVNLFNILIMTTKAKKMLWTLWMVLILPVVQLAMQQNCPSQICTCESQGIKANNYIVKAVCTDLPKLMPPTLMSLKITTNIQTITHGILEPVLRVSYLELSGCNISSIDIGAFVNMTNLVNLDLSHNKLVDFLPGAFQSITTLRTLFLDYNLLEEINDELFVGLINLDFLSLSNNRLHTLPAQLPASLRKLNVSFNEIGPSIGHNNSQLLFQGETLDLYGNQIRSIENWDWIDTSKLQNLWIGLSKVATSENVTFDEIDSLTICGNESVLDDNTQGILKGMINLQNLTLENFVVDTMVFLHSMKKLKNLKLKHMIHTNSVNVYEAFSNFQELQSLDFEGSAEIAHGFINDSQRLKDTFYNLQHISFRNCDIKTILLNDFSWYNGNGKIDIRDNPLDCTCSKDNWIVHNINKISDLQQTFCDSPQNEISQSIMIICKERKNEMSAKIKDTIIKNNSTNEHQKRGSLTKDIIFELVLVTLIILVIALFIIWLYLHHPVMEQPPARLQEIHHSEEEGEDEQRQRPTKC